MKKVPYKILFLIILLLPVITFAETKYKLDKEYTFLATQVYITSDNLNKGYSSVLGVSDDYVFIQGRGAIYIHDKDLNYVSAVSGVSGYKFIEDSNGDYFYNITSQSLGNSQYEYYIRKIDTDFKEISKVQIKFENNNSKIFSHVMMDNKIYAIYFTGSYPNFEYHTIIIDESGNIISDKVLSQASTLYSLNNKIYYVQNKKVGSSYNSEIYSLNESGESELIRNFDNISITGIKYDAQKKNYVVSYYTYQSNGTKSDKSVMIVDYNLDKILLEKTLLDLYNGELICTNEFDNISVTDKYYIFNITRPGTSSSSEQYVNPYEPYIYPYTALKIYDKDFKYQGTIYYGNKVLQQLTDHSYWDYYWNGSSILVQDNEIYLVGDTAGVYADFEGDYIAKFTIDDLYKVDQEVKAGEGIIDQSELSAFPGEEVTYSATPAEGYVLSSLKVITENGDPVEVTDNKFIMPNERVIIQAEFIKEEPELPPEEENNEEELPKEDPPKETTKEENPNTSDKIIIIISIAITTSLIILLLYRYKKLNI